MEQRQPPDTRRRRKWPGLHWGQSLRQPEAKKPDDLLSNRPPPLIRHRAPSADKLRFSGQVEHIAPGQGLPLQGIIPIHRGLGRPTPWPSCGLPPTRRVRACDRPLPKRLEDTAEDYIGGPARPPWPPSAGHSG